MLDSIFIFILLWQLAMSSYRWLSYMSTRCGKSLALDPQSKYQIALPLTEDTSF